MVSLTFDETTRTDGVPTCASADGAVDTIEVHAVVSGVGQLNRPNLPDIEGMDTFDGPAFHSARWRTTSTSPESGSR